MSSAEVYSPREIARAAGVPEEQAIAAVGRANALVSYVDAVRLARALRRDTVGVSGSRGQSGSNRMPRGVDEPAPLFSIFTVLPARRKGVPLAASGTLHAALFAGVMVITTLGLQPSATALPVDLNPAEPMRLVFLATPGPGGGGGGGGLLQKSPAPKALREGKRPISSPLPVRRPPPPMEPTVKAPEPTPPPLQAEALPIIVAPIVTAPADLQDRIGVLEEARAEKDSRGPGSGVGVGSGTGTGLGEGNGAGVGPGSGGGTGGGPYHPGAGIEPPRLLREVKPDYPEDARQRGLEGEVVMEIVVRRDGSVGDVKILRGLGAGLNDRATQAVRQWRFSPARRLGSPVDVIVEVSVEFKMR